MQQRENMFWQDVLLAITVAIVGYTALLSTPRTGLVDTSIEAALFFTGSIFALRGFVKSKPGMDNNFKKFELFFGLSYLMVVISFIMCIIYLVVNPSVAEIGVADIKGSNWLIVMSIIKSFAVILLIFAWSYFYKYLNLKQSSKKKIAVFLLGTLIYIGASIVVWRLTGDVDVLGLGIIVGSIIGIFALIAQDRRARYLTMIFAIYSSIHLTEFYVMGIGKNLTTGITNPIYWGVTVLYVLEVKRWIDRELYSVQ